MAKRRSHNSPERRRTIRHHVVPAAVWLATVTVIAGLFYQRASQIQVLGVARGRTYRVATTCTGRIHEVSVQLYEEVQAGQTLLTIDTLSEAEHEANRLAAKELEAEQSTLQTRIEFLRAQLAAREDTREDQLVDQAVQSQANRFSDERIFSVGVETARMRVLDLERQLAAERIALGTVQDEIDTLSQLADQNAISPFEVEQAKRRRTRVQEKIDQYTKLQQVARTSLDDALARQREFLALPTSPLAGDIEGMISAAQRIRAVAQQEIDVELHRLAEIKQRLANLRQPRIVPLTAPFAGTISHLYLQPGEVVDVNAPAMQLAEQRPTEVIAYVPEQQADRIRAGMTVEVVKGGTPLTLARHCEIVAVSPVIEQLPVQLWHHPNLPQWGRSFVVRVPEELGLLVGEKVGIREL